MSKIRVFVSFDTEHDGELYELLLAQSGDHELRFRGVGRLRASDGHGCLERESAPPDP